MWKGLQETFSKVHFVLIALLIAVIIFTVAVLFPNISLLTQVLPSPYISFGHKISLVLSLFGSIGSNFTVLSASYTIAIAVLFGMNISLFIHYIRDRRGALQAKSSATSIGGLISGVFGIGCATCGTFILTWLLGMFGAAGILSLLPLKGSEFGILGVILLAYSVYTTAKKISAPKVC